MSLNGIPRPWPIELLVPPSGFVVNAAWPAIEGASVRAELRDAHGHVDAATRLLAPEGDGRGRVVTPSEALAPGAYQLRVELEMPGDGTPGLERDEIVFRVAHFPDGRAPIASGQGFWLDFDADRDEIPGADFDADLMAFGLVSNGAPPALLDHVKRRVIAQALERVRDLYAGIDSAALRRPDPVAVSFSAQDPGLPDTTHICVGGADPTGGSSVGHIELDLSNARRSGALCGPDPPGGVYPRELLTYEDEAGFRAVFDSLRETSGGIPFGAHALDAVVLIAELDPQAPSPSRAAGDRRHAIDGALRALGTALGTVLAHEVGHALGLVPPSLGGGSKGEAYAHAPPGDAADATNARAARSANGDAPRLVRSLMEPGRSFGFADLAGLPGGAVIRLRPLDHAYLRDRIVLAPDADPARP